MIITTSIIKSTSITRTRDTRAKKAIVATATETPD